MAKNKDPLLKDILLEDVDSEGYIFKQFKERKDILKQVLDEFTSGRYSNTEQDKEITGYYISDNDRGEVGVISYALTISTFVALLSKGELISEVYKSNAVIVANFKGILAGTGYKPEMINSKNETSALVYSAEPYINDKNFKTKSGVANTKITTYTDTMAKILVAACDMRFYLLRCKENKLEVENFDYYLTATEDLIALTMKDLAAAAIRLETPIRFKPFATSIEKVDTTDYASKKDPNDIWYKGWNFLSANYRGTKIDETKYGFSYYVTYSVCQAYTTVYNYFEWNIKECRHHRDYQLKNKKENRADNIEPYKGIKVPGNRLAAFKESQEFFEKIFEKYFFPFSKTVLDVGRYLNVRIYEKKDLDIATSFIGNDFAAISQEDIEISSTNDALFNTLFTFSIFLASGIDIDYEAFGEAAKERYFTDLNYGLINVDKCLKYLMKNNKEYIVKQHILSVWEKIPTDIDYFAVNAKKIRKRRIQAMTIVPLLISVHSEISKYITRYPEREMSTYLRYIMEKRYRDEKGEPYWAWDDDGYDLNNTLLYINALNSFYDYYEVYEAPFYNKEVENTKLVKDIKEEVGKEVLEKEEVIQDLQNQIAALKQKDALTLALEGIISNYLDEQLSNRLVKLFTNEALNNSIKDRDENYAPLYKAFSDMMFSCVVQQARLNSDLQITSIDEQNGGYKINPEVVRKMIDIFREEMLKEWGKQAIESYKSKEGV